MPFVERERELSSLRRALASVGAPGAKSIVVLGPPGIGKTTLISTVADESREWLLLRASGTPLGAEVPYGIIFQLFGGLVRKTNRGAPPFDGPGARLRELLVDAKAPADSAALAYSLQWAVARLAEKRRVLIVVDDLHWVDASSLTILGHAIGLLEAEPVALLFGVRSSSTDFGDPVLSAIIEASTIVTPGPLTLDGVSAIVGEDGADAATIHELSGGNPFYVTELISLAAAGQELTSSEQVTASIGGRLDRLGPEHRLVACAVAVLGPDSGRAAVARLTGIDEVALGPIMRALVTDGILADSDRPTASHPLVGEAIRRGMGAVRLADFHDHAARVMDELGANAMCVASHLLHGSGSQDEWCSKIMISAARAALQGGSPVAAVTYFNRALEGLLADDPRRPGLVLEAAAANGAAGDRTAAAAFWRLSLAYAVNVGARVRILADLGDALFASGDYASAEASYAQGINELTAANSATTEPVFREFVARTLSAQLSLTMTPSALSQVILRQTIDQDPRLDTAEDARLLAAAAVGLTITGDPEANIRALALRAYRRWPINAVGTADDPTTYLLSGALNFAGLFTEGVDLLTSAVRAAAAGGQVLSEATARYCRGAMYFSEGGLRRAVPDLAAAVNAVGFGWSHYREAAETLLIQCHLMVGDIAAAATIALAPEYESASDMLLSIQLLGKSQYWTKVGSPARGLELARRAGELLPFGAESMGLGWRSAAGSALLALGRKDAAHELALEEVVLAERSGRSTPALVPALIRLASTDENPDEAGAAARRALDVVAPSRRLDLFRARELLAGLLLAEGRDDEAAIYLQPALDYAQSQGLTAAERRLRSSLASIGRTIIPSSIERRISSLSPAEYRVAALAAQGLSNREIAGSLFVTVKTVEFHLSRCYRKLDVQNRRDLNVLFEKTSIAE